MFHPVVMNALVAGIIIACISAPLGCFLIWKRISSFSDAVSHIALPGIAVSVITGVSSFFCSALVIFAAAAAVGVIKEKSRTSANSLLVALAQIGMGGGYLLLSLFGKGNGFTVLLFGDILSVTLYDIGVIAVVAVFVIYSLFKIADKLLLSVLCEDIAVTEGVNVKKINLFFMMLLSFSVAVSIKTVGILLMSSLLIIPPLASRMLTKSYKKMFVVSPVIGIFAVSGGVFMSFLVDVPPIAAIVSLLGLEVVIIFFVQFMIKCFKKTH